jgi:hypothetical protein
MRIRIPVGSVPATKFTLDFLSRVPPLTVKRVQPTAIALLATGEAADAPPTKPSPIDTAWPALQGGARLPSDQALAVTNTGLQHCLEQSQLCSAQLSCKFCRRRTFAFKLPIDPRNKQKVACPGLHCGRARKEIVGESVTDCSYSNLVQSSLVAKLIDEIEHRAPGSFIDIDPGKAGRHYLLLPECIAAPMGLLQMLHGLSPITAVLFVARLHRGGT